MGLQPYIISLLEGWVNTTHRPPSHSEDYVRLHLPTRHDVEPRNYAGNAKEGRQPPCAVFAAAEWSDGNGGRCLRWKFQDIEPN